MNSLLISTWCRQFLTKNGHRFNAIKLNDCSHHMYRCKYNHCILKPDHFIIANVKTTEKMMQKLRLCCFRKWKSFHAQKKMTSVHKYTTNYSFHGHLKPQFQQIHRFAQNFQYSVSILRHSIRLLGVENFRRTNPKHRMWCVRVCAFVRVRVYTSVIHFTT